MTTLDLDALERAAEEWKAKIRNDATPSQVGPTEADIDSILMAFRALQERVEGAEKALRPFSNFVNDEYDDVPNVVGVSLTFDNGEEIGALPFGDLRAARVYFAARTKAGEPHPEQGGE